MWWTSVLAILGLAAFIGGQKEALLFLIIWIAWPLLRQVIQNLRDNSRRAVGKRKKESIRVTLANLDPFQRFGGGVATPPHTPCLHLAMVRVRHKQRITHRTTK
ncbi:hypothetical protein CSW50_08440 [Thermus scotoductus]|uniref:Uncharacterized protein n=1 Tax=Thermus scotoductus TaxID=37636 RepID=A0A430R3Q1_THESC|nr:hypothetical protein CSW50_08440 [Thermus scotoductus]